MLTKKWSNYIWSGLLLAILRWEDRRSFFSLAFFSLANFFKLLVKFAWKARCKKENARLNKWLERTENVSCIEMRAETYARLPESVCVREKKKKSFVIVFDSTECIHIRLQLKYKYQYLVYFCCCCEKSWICSLTVS